MVAPKPPLEDAECFVFHEWLEINNIPHEHVPNESRSSKRDAAIRGRKLKKMGVSKGFWDYIVFIPVFDIDGEVSTYEIAIVEMKRKKGSTTSKEQKAWGGVYEKANIRHKICKGAGEAIEFILECAKEISDETYGNLKSEEKELF